MIHRNMPSARYYPYQDNGLVQPHRVSVAMGNLRTVSDTVGLFLLSGCFFEPESPDDPAGTYGHV
jgi:hypothetical protein